MFLGGKLENFIKLFSCIKFITCSQKSDWIFIPIYPLVLDWSTPLLIKKLDVELGGKNEDEDEAFEDEEAFDDEAFDDEAFADEADEADEADDDEEDAVNTDFFPSTWIFILL